MMLDVILITSDTEGTPRAVLESMLYNSICISTNVGGLKEIIHDKKNGFLCKPNSSNVLTTKILDVYSLSEQERDKISENGKNTVLNKFLINKMCEKIINVYDSLKGK